jgi:hypothetical protein
MPTNTYFRNSKEDLEYNTITGEYTNVATAVIATRDSATDTYYTKKLNKVSVFKGSTVKYFVQSDGYTSYSGTIENIQAPYTKAVNLQKEVSSANLTLEIRWAAAPAGSIKMLADGVLFYDFSGEAKASNTSIYNFELPIGTKITFTNTSNSTFEGSSGDIICEYSGHDYLYNYVFTVNGDGTLIIYSSIDK